MKIKLMADYRCHPLWDEQSGKNIDPNNLPISDLLKKELIVWSEVYDQKLKWDDPISSGFQSAEDVTTFVKDGRSLCQKLTQELGEKFTVIFPSEYYYTAVTEI